MPTHAINNQLDRTSAPVTIRNTCSLDCFPHAIAHKFLNENMPQNKIQAQADISPIKNTLHLYMHEISHLTSGRRFARCSSPSPPSATQRRSARIRIALAALVALTTSPAPSLFFARLLQNAGSTADRLGSASTWHAHEQGQVEHETTRVRSHLGGCEKHDKKWRKSAPQ